MNISLTGEQTIDGYLTSSSRVAVKSQTVSAENGLYVSAAGSWSRATDMDAAGEVQFSSVFVMNGAENRGKLFYVPDSVSALDTDPIVFIETQTTEWLKLTGSLFPFANPKETAEAAALDRIKKFEIYGGDPTKRYSVDTWYNDGTPRFSVRVWEHSDLAGTAAVNVATYAESGGATGWAGLKVFSLVDIGGSGIKAEATLDFDGAATFSIYPSTTAAQWQQRSLAPRVLVDSPTRDANITTIVKGALAAQLKSVGHQLPFADDVLNVDLRRVVRDCWVMDGEPDEAYALSSFGIEAAGGGNNRLTIRLRAINRGVDVIEYSKTSGVMSVADFVSTIPKMLQMTDFLPSDPANKTRTRLQITLDLAGVTDYFQYGSTNFSVAGIHPSHVLKMDQQDDYLRDDRVDRLIKIGVGQEFTTVDAALTALGNFWFGSANVNKRPLSDEASYINRVRLYLTDRVEYPFSMDLPDYVEVDSIPGAVMRNDAPATSGALQFLGNGKVDNIHIVTVATNKYGAHLDPTDAPVSSQGQFATIRQRLKNVTIEIPESSSVDGLGGGVSSNSQIAIANLCIPGGATEDAYKAGISFHNYGAIASVPGTVASPLPARVSISGGKNDYRVGLRLYGVAAGPINICNVSDVQFRSILMAVATADVNAPDLAADRTTWRLAGHYDGPVSWTDPSGAYVLKTTPGQTPSGDAATLIFGTMDNLGRGTKWVKDGTWASLDARLGDCATVNKTLTIGGENCIFTTDLTSATNAAVLSIINAAITTHTCSVVNIAGEFIADATPQMPVIGAAAAFEKGRFMTRSVAGVWGYAQSGDTIHGWTWRTIPSSGRGTVGTPKRIAASVITGADSGTGDFGVSADGLLDFAATPKIGRVWADGVVEVW